MRLPSVPAVQAFYPLDTWWWMLSFYAEMIANINIIQLFQVYQRFIDSPHWSRLRPVLSSSYLVANIQAFAWNKESQ